MKRLIKNYNLYYMRKKVSVIYKYMKVKEASITIYTLTRCR